AVLGAVDPRAEPAPEVAAARDGREVVELIEEAQLDQPLQQSEVERRAADAAAGEAERRARPDGRILHRGAVAFVHEPDDPLEFTPGVGPFAAGLRCVAALAGVAVLDRVATERDELLAQDLPEFLGRFARLRFAGHVALPPRSVPGTAAVRGKGRGARPRPISR